MKGNQIDEERECQISVMTQQKVLRVYHSNMVKKHSKGTREVEKMIPNIVDRYEHHQRDTDLIACIYFSPSFKVLWWPSTSSTIPSCVGGKE